MLVRSLAALVLASLSVGFAPVPFPHPKKKTGPTPEELARRFDGTWRVASYEYGNNALRRGIAVRNLYSQVIIKGDSWTQIRDVGGRRINQVYQLKTDTKKPVPEMTLGYKGNPQPTFVGFMTFTGANRLTVTYTVRGRPAVNPLGALGVAQYRWVLERTGK